MPEDRLHRRPAIAEVDARERVACYQVRAMCLVTAANRTAGLREYEREGHYRCNPHPAIVLAHAVAYHARYDEYAVVSGLRILAAIAVSLAAAIATRVWPCIGHALTAAALWFDAATLAHEGYDH
jgi:hypothetical protein